jgi:hypothetical protein
MIVMVEVIILNDGFIMVMVEVIVESMDSMMVMVEINCSCYYGIEQWYMIGWDAEM